MEICRRCDGSGEMGTECCNGSGGCSCGGGLVYTTCTYCGGSGQVENYTEAEKKGHAEFMRRFGGQCFLGTGPKTGYWSKFGGAGLYPKD